jgi:hypothetical protein
MAAMIAADEIDGLTTAEGAAAYTATVGKRY